MKSKITLLSFLLLFVMLVADQQNKVAISNNAGAPAGHTGSPSDNKTCATTGCHLGSAVIPTPGIITSNIPTSGYLPGSTYTITCSVSQAGINEFGFQVSPMSSTGLLRGQPIITNPTTTKIVATKYITHTTAGTPGAGSKTWSFNWVAPSAGTGSVTFYGAFNYTNSNNSTTGDVIHTSTMVVQEDLTSGLPESIAGVFKANIFPNPFQNSLDISYSLPLAENVDIFIHDTGGRLVRHIAKGMQAPGQYRAEINVDAAFTTGVYFITLISGAGKQTVKALKL